jgi:hypothetical protein
MPFRENNKLGAKKFLDKPLDALPISLKGYLGQKEALRNVPDWQERLRELIDTLIEENENKKPSSEGRGF